MCAAKDLAEKVGKTISEDYAAAVKWCLDVDRHNRHNRPFGGGGSVTAGERDPGAGPLRAWRRDVLDHVVGRLKMCCEWVVGKGQGLEVGEGGDGGDGDVE